MHPKSIEITGLTQEWVDGQALTAQDVLKCWLKWMDTYCQDPTLPRGLLSYNGHLFDLCFLVMEATHWPKGAESFFRDLKLAFSLDVLVAGGQEERFDRSKLQRYANGKCILKLGSVYQSLLQKPLQNAHGGLADCKAVIELVQYCYSTFESYFQDAVLGNMSSDAMKNVMILMRDILAKAPKKQEEGKDQINVMDRLLEMKKKKLRASSRKGEEEQSTETENASSKRQKVDWSG
jgi:DNA polymerase III epsilon subunit-like protein